MAGGRAENVRKLFDAIDRSIEDGTWGNPEFDELLHQLETAIVDAYPPSSRTVVVGELGGSND